MCPNLHTKDDKDARSQQAPELLSSTWNYLSYSSNPDLFPEAQGQV